MQHGITHINIIFPIKMKLGFLLKLPENLKGYKNGHKAKHFQLGFVSVYRSISEETRLFKGGRGMLKQRPYRFAAVFHEE